MSPTTRQRILDAASDLFMTKGYEATSLREIADRLGFTKAALYYHFQSKDQILIALLEPAHDVIGQMLDRLEAAEGIEGWGETLFWLIGQLAEHASFLRLIERNRAAVDQLDLMATVVGDHRTLYERVRKAAAAKAADRREQVRMVAALAAVTGLDDWDPALITDTPPDELEAELSAAVKDMLGLGRRRVRRSPD